MESNPSSKRVELLDASTQRTGDIYSLVKDVYASASYFSESFDEKFPDVSSLEKYVQSVSKDMRGIFLLSYNERLTGYIIVEPRREKNLRHTAYLNMGVHPDERGRGLGKALLEEAWKRLKDLEIVYLMVRSDNHGAIQLYEKFGFSRLVVLENDTKTSDGNYFDGLLMRKHTKFFSKV